MADYVFKVQLLLPGNIVETVILRQYIDPVDRCFDRFKSNLIQRFDVLTNATFKMMWIDNDGDKISIYNEEDLRTYMELKGTKIFVEVDDGSNQKEKKSSTDNAAPTLLRSPHFLRHRFAERERPMCGGRYRMFAQPDVEANGNNVDAGSASSGAQAPLHSHVGVTCDGCNCAIRGYRYKCIECPDYDLCFSCEMKKIHGDHMMLRIVKPLDRPFNRHFLKAMLKQRCRESGEEKEKDKRARGRHSTAFANFDDIMTDIAKNYSVNCTTQATNETKNVEQNVNAQIDPKQFLLNSETFAKAGEVLSNLAQHFVSVMDPFAVHEFIPTTEPNGNATGAPVSTSNAQREPKNTNCCEAVPVEENQDKNANAAAPSAVPTPPQSNTPAVPVERDTNNLVTIEDDVEIPSAPREASPAQDWAMVDAFGTVEEAPGQSNHTGAIPKTPAIPTPASVGSVDAAQAMPNYAVLARDLEDHLRTTLKSQSSQTPTQTPPQMPIVHHHNPKINEAIITMTSMGFSNGGGWLTRLLENVDGDIPKALEKLHPSQ